MEKWALKGIRACVFDAYGTLFDVNSSARSARAELGERWQALADLWRLKQLQYTWLRGLGGHHADFWQVTGDALDFAMATLRMKDPVLRQRLMDLYLSLSCYPEVPETLRALKHQGKRLAILSNGTPAMLDAAVTNSGLAGVFDHVLSVEEVGVYKPHPSVYRLAAERLAIAPGEGCFVSSNGWDACAAQSNGFRAVWCNRSGQEPERVPDAPEGSITSLSELVGVLGLAAA
jgi:2-haloacid dehalogenase